MNKPRTTNAESAARPVLHGVDWAVAAGVTEEVMLGTRRRVRRRRQQYLAIAGAVGALVVAALGWNQFSRVGQTPGVPAVRTTAVSAPAKQSLPDGTVVELKEGAEIAVRYSASARRVSLLRGEAHFLVVKDVARPFVVAVNSVEVRAVGTSFAVQRREGQIEVVVTTGQVAVDRVTDVDAGSAASPAPLQTIATLDAGHRTLVEVAPTPVAPVVENLSPAEIGQRLAWRVPRLEFTRTPLAEAVPMINEHSAVKLALADEALGEVRISGLLRVDNIETLFHLLEVEHGIRAERRSASEVVLNAAR